MADEVLGRVASLRRYPVKSMLGEEVERVDVAQRGVVGDRAYALVDDETDKVVSVKRPRRWGRIFELSAATSSEGVVQVRFPDGACLALDDPALPAALSGFFGRPVSVAATPPPDATFDEAWVRELKNDAEPYFGVPSRVEEGDELIDAGQFMSGMGNFFNFGSVHLMTTSTTRRLEEHAPDSVFDGRRFRANITVDTEGDGFVETGWQGRMLQVGGVRMMVTMTVPRCVMTTLPQGALPADQNVLRTVTALNSVDVFGTGTSYPCVGVYAEVLEAGAVAVGDEVRLL